MTFVWVSHWSQTSGCFSQTDHDRDRVLLCSLADGRGPGADHCKCGPCPGEGETHLRVHWWSHCSSHRAWMEHCEVTASHHNSSISATDFWTSAQKYLKHHLIYAGVNIEHWKILPLRSYDLNWALRKVLSVCPLGWLPLNLPPQGWQGRN